MNIDDYNDQVSVEDVCKTLKLIPSIIKLIKSIDKKSFYMIIVISLIVGICPIITLMSSQHLLNMIATKQLRMVAGAFIFFVVANLFNEIMTTFMEYYQNKFQIVINYHLNYRVMDKCTKLALKDFENSEIYDKLQRVQNETAFRPYQVFLAIINLVTAIVTLISATMIIINWKPWVLGILIIIPATFSIYFFKIGQREFNISWERAADRRKAWYLTYLLTRDNTFKEIKLYGIGKYLLDKFKKINVGFVHQDIKLFKRRSIFTLIFEIVQQICTNGILIIIIYSACIGEILIGNVVGYINALNLVETNCKQIINLIYNLYSNNLYVKQLFEFLDLDEEQVDQEEGITLEEVQELTIKDLSFTYPSATNKALNHLNLSVRKGERIAIIGQNGSGKSTLVKLLVKLYEINEGIYYNGHAINEYNSKSLNQHIAVLLQDFTKYEMSLRENIGFGNIEQIDNDEAIRNALQKANVTFIDDLNQQLGLWFENGRQLSGGQWQKVALARTFFRQASMYILDEPSSALDPIAEQKIMNMFMKLTENKMGIFISHRIANAMLADKIVVMDQGKIIGVGTHQELIATNEIYRTMYEAEMKKGE